LDLILLIFSVKLISSFSFLLSLYNRLEKKIIKNLLLLGFFAVVVVLLELPKDLVNLGY